MLNTTIEEAFEINPTITIKRDAEVPFLSMDRLTPGQRDVDAGEIRQFRSGSKFAAGDTLMARITPCLENKKIARYLPNNSFNNIAAGSTEFIVLRGKPGITTTEFSYYFAITPTIHETAIALMTGTSGRQRVDMAAFRAQEVEIPELAEQRKITDLLGALDDKIVANRLVIEKIHALLHAKWHAITSTGASSTQPISSIADVNPRMPKPHRGECSFLEMKDLPEFGLIVDQWASRATKGGTKFKNGDVLLARITPCFENGKMAIVDFLEDDEVGMGSTEYIVFRPKEGIPAAAIHAIIASPEFRGFGYKALTGTSGRQRIATDDLKEIAVPWPSESALTEYRQLADALLKKATALRNENQVLARSRDELLPLLMSGHITVGEAEDAADIAGTAASES